jgi:hypothetical protein
MEQHIRKLENIDLTGEDIMRMVDGKTNVIEYNDLKNATNLENLFRNDTLVILYETRKGFGHWVCLIKRGINHVDFFDPYGLKVDEELNIINENHIRQNDEGQVVPHLTSLLQNGGYRVDENLTKLQKFMKDVNTCGRWVVVRILLKHIEQKRFENLFCCNKNADGDWYVSAMTFFL